jgi:hypothetical protein
MRQQNKHNHYPSLFRTMVILIVSVNVVSSETLAPFYQITRRQLQEGFNFYNTALLNVKTRDSYHDIYIRVYITLTHFYDVCYTINTTQEP